MHFVTMLHFTEQGARSLNGTTSRADLFRQEAEAAGLKIHQQLWTQGSVDGILIYEAATAEIAAREMLKLASHGYVRTVTLPAYNSNEMAKLLP